MCQSVVLKTHHTHNTLLHLRERKFKKCLFDCVVEYGRDSKEPYIFTWTNPNILIDETGEQHTFKVTEHGKRQSQSYISTDSNWCRPISVPIQKWCSFNTIFVLALRQIGLLFESKNHTVNIYVHVYFANSFRTLPLGLLSIPRGPTTYRWRKKNHHRGGSEKYLSKRTSLNPPRVHP